MEAHQSKERRKRLLLRKITRSTEDDYHGILLELNGAIYRQSGLHISLVWNGAGRLSPGIFSLFSVYDRVCHND